MTGEEIKDALLKGYAVTAHDNDFKRVNAIIYRLQQGKIAVSAELQSNRGNSITIVSIDSITKKEG